MTNITNFQNDMATKGLTPGKIIADGKIHRFPISDKRRDQNGWYVFYPETGAGAYGDWRQGNKYTWSAASKSTMTESQRQAFSARMEKAQEQMKQAKSQARKNAAQKADKLWNKARPADPKHPYLIKKGVKPNDSIRQIGLTLVVPVKSLDDALTSLQFIFSNGTKRFLSGGQISGCFYWIKGDKGMVLFCEGWATAQSLSDATGCSVIIAFNAGNLQVVAEKLRTKIKKRIIICGDNDEWTFKQDGTPWNPGREKALSTAWELNSRVAVPRFQSTEKKPTDFNDLASQEGFDIVKAQVEAAKLPKDFLLEECQNDKGAAFRPEHLQGLRQLRKRDFATFQTLRNDLKKLQIGVTALDDAMAGKAGGGSAEQAGENPEESVAAEIISGPLTNVYAFDKRSENWFRYNEGLWLEAYKQDIRETVSRLMRDSAFFPESYKNSYFNGILQLLRNHLIFGSEPKNKGLLPFKNGVLDIATKTLKSIGPRYGFTWQLPYKYDPEAKCQKILDWFNEMTGGSEDLVLLLRAFLHAVLLGYVDLHRFLELIGPGGSGKSTFIWLAEQLVGAANTITSEIRYLEQNRFETASLYLKRLVLITDAERYAGEVSVLKALTGGDTLRYEEKYKQSRNSFQPEAMVIIAANQEIQSRDFTSGLQRRRITVYFRNQIPQEKQRDLKTEFTPYIPGLMNWVLDMDRDEVFSILKSRRSEVQNKDFMESLLATNPIAEWLNDNVVYEPSTEQKVYVGIATRIPNNSGFENENSKLYPNYAKFCVTHNYRPVSLKRFRSLLMDLIQSQLLLNDIKDEKDQKGRHLTMIRLRDRESDDYKTVYSPVYAAFMRDEGEI